MFTKDNIKFYTLIVFIGIVMFKFINSPSEITLYINNIISFFSPFIWGLTFVSILNPVVFLLQTKFKLHRLVCIFISYLIFSLIFSITITAILPIISKSLTDLIYLIPNYIDSFNNIYNAYLPLDSTFEILSPYIKDFLYSLLNSLLSMFSKYSSNIFFYIFNITSVVFDIIIGIVISIYIIYDKENIISSLKSLLKNLFSKNSYNNILSFCVYSNKVFYSFIVGQILDSLIVSIISFMGFYFIFNLDNALFFSFIIFITNMIPYFGPIISSVLPIFTTFFYDPIKSFWILVFILIIQQIDANIISPKIMQNQIGLSPLVIISSIIICSSILGLVGVFFAIPITAIIKYLFINYIKKS